MVGGYHCIALLESWFERTHGCLLVDLWSELTIGAEEF